jgi:hypothetical protein
MLIDDERKNTIAIATMMNTIDRGHAVSLRVGQVTLRASWRTSAKNCDRLVKRLGAG